MVHQSKPELRYHRQCHRGAPCDLPYPNTTYLIQPFLFGMMQSMKYWPMQWKCQKNGCQRASGKSGVSQTMSTRMNITRASHILKLVNHHQLQKIDANSSTQTHMARGNVQGIKHHCGRVEINRRNTNSQILNSRGDCSDPNQPHHHICQNCR